MAIHKFELNGYKIVLDVNSGALHQMDDVSYDVVDFINGKTVDDAINALNRRYSKEDIVEAYDELNKLKEMGMLFSPDPLKGMEITHNRDKVIKSMCLNISHDCNLRCKYCFASQGDFNGERKLMPLEVGKKAIDFLVSHSGTRKHLEVDMFGGEPLLNYDVMKEIVKYGNEAAKAKGKSINFTITTNAVTLDDEKRNYIDDNFYNVVLSLDGRPEVNDGMRTHANGSGSYKNIVNNIVEMAHLRKDKEYYVRGTYTKYNLDFADDVLHIVDLGIDRVSVEPVVTSSDKDYALGFEDLPAIREQYHKLANEYIKRYKEDRPFDFFHFDIDLDNGPCIYKRIKGCGAGNEYVAVTPDGDIYPCHQFVGIDESKMGNVLTGEINEGLQIKFSKCNIYTKPKCSACWAKFICSGGCHANAYQYNGDIFSPHELSCEILKIRTEYALMIKVALSDLSE